MVPTNLFGPVGPTASPAATQPNSFGIGSLQSPTVATHTVGAEVLQQQMLQQNQMLVQTMLHRMDAEDRRRAEEEKRRKDEETAAKKAAEAVTTVLLDPFAGPETGSSSSGAVPTYTGTVVFSGNRAEKYLPPRPPLQHGAMGKSRMKEVEEWHRFVEVYSSWLALIDEAYVNEFRLALRHPHEIVQAKLAKDVAARSAKLFYYLGQSLAKWERGLELLRSVSKRQDMSAAGYEVVRTIHMNYSIVSRMEAVHVRDQALALHKHCNHLRKPLEIIRHLEDELAKAESKLGNFPDLRLSPADKCTLLLQAISSEARQYVVLRGKTSTWDDLTASLKFFEEQLRLCEVPGHTRAASEVLCDYCGKKGHKKENCWQKKKDEKGSPSKGGKGEKGKGKKGEKGKGGDTPRGGKGDKGKGEQPKGKGKKKKKKGQRVRSAGETSESEAESSAPGTPKKATAMALRVRFDPCENGELSGVGRVLRDSEPEPAVTSSVFVSQDTNFLGTIGSLCSSEDVKRVCAIHEVEARDVWLVDSGATCHIIATDFLGGFRVVKRRERPVTLYNASGGEIKVHGIVDIEFHFGNLCLVLEEVLVADVGFNAISPWAAAEKGWRTHLFKTGSRLFKGKRNLRLEGLNRAWWAISRQSKKSKRKPRGGGSSTDMDLDAARRTSNSTPPAGILKHEESPSPLETVPPRNTATTRESRRALDSSPFAFLIRGLRVYEEPVVNVDRVFHDCRECPEDTSMWEPMTGHDYLEVFHECLEFSEGTCASMRENVVCHVGHEGFEKSFDGSMREHGVCDTGFAMKHDHVRRHDLDLQHVFSWLTCIFVAPWTFCMDMCKGILTCATFCFGRKEWTAPARVLRSRYLPGFVGKYVSARTCLACSGPPRPEVEVKRKGFRRPFMKALLMNRLQQLWILIFLLVLFRGKSHRVFCEDTSGGLSSLVYLTQGIWVPTHPADGVSRFAGGTIGAGVSGTHCRQRHEWQFLGCYQLPREFTPGEGCPSLCWRPLPQHRSCPWSAVCDGKCAPGRPFRPSTRPGGQAYGSDLIGRSASSRWKLAPRKSQGFAARFRSFVVSSAMLLVPLELRKGSGSSRPRTLPCTQWTRVSG